MYDGLGGTFEDYTIMKLVQGSNGHYRFLVGIIRVATLRHLQYARWVWVLFCIQGSHNSLCDNSRALPTPEG